MSGITGIVHFDDRPVEPRQIEVMTAAMSTRGPDGLHYWRRGNVALGHCTLRATPESAEECQPLSDEDESLVLVWDGRLDNREELRREILHSGAQIRDDSDAELVMQSFVLWREKCPARLLGDFAFAVWDRTRQELFCAVDHIGAKPLYYALTRESFAFASEEEVLLALPGVSAQPNEQQIADMFVLPSDSFDSQLSWLRDVSSLMPGNLVVVTRDGKARVSCYWQLDPGEERAYASDEECQEEFLSVFAESVRCRMRASGPVAAMVSGGMDSAAILAMVLRLRPEMPGKQFGAFSAIADDPDNCIESQCILAMTERLGVNAHSVSVPSFNGMLSERDLFDVTWTRPHPSDNSIMLPALMCQAAGRQGHRVILAGVSGDLAMMGPNRYPAHLLREGHWPTAWRECVAMSKNHLFSRGVLPSKLFLSNAWSAFAPAVARSAVSRARYRETRLTYIDDEFSGRLNLVERLQQQVARQVASRVDGNHHRQQLARVLGGPWGLASGLTGYDQVAGRYGVEFRDPWADRRVVEFYLRLPPRFKQRGGWTKYLARTVFTPDFGGQVTWRRGKEHLGPNFLKLIMESCRSTVSEHRGRWMGPGRRYVDVDAIVARLKQDKEGADVEATCLLMDVIVMEAWLERIEILKAKFAKMW